MCQVMVQYNIVHIIFLSLLVAPQIPLEGSAYLFWSVPRHKRFSIFGNPVNQLKAFTTTTHAPVKTPPTTSRNTPTPTPPTTPVPITTTATTTTTSPVIFSATAETTNTGADLEATVGGASLQGRSVLDTFDLNMPSLSSSEDNGNSFDKTPIAALVDEGEGEGQGERRPRGSHSHSRKKGAKNHAKKRRFDMDDEMNDMNGNNDDADDGDDDVGDPNQNEPLYY